MSKATIKLLRPGGKPDTLTHTEMTPADWIEVIESLGEFMQYAAQQARKKAPLRADLKTIILN